MRPWGDSALVDEVRCPVCRSVGAVVSGGACPRCAGLLDYERRRRIAFDGPLKRTILLGVVAGWLDDTPCVLVRTGYRGLVEAVAPAWARPLVQAGTRVTVIGDDGDARVDCVLLWAQTAVASPDGGEQSGS